jgi:hypothetical protein
VKKIALLGTRHSIQWGEDSPGQFRNLLEEQYRQHGFMTIAEENNKMKPSIPRDFCNENGLEYYRVDLDAEERKTLGIESRGEIEYQIPKEYKRRYGMFPGRLDFDGTCFFGEHGPEASAEYIERAEASDRAREAVWLDRVKDMSGWPILFICGANHFRPFEVLLTSSGFQVTETCPDWTPV